MWPAKRLDFDWSDVAAAIRDCLGSRPAEDAAFDLEQQWAGEEALACLSVRTGFDLLLAALDFPPGSEILMSAVTIPDMVRIALHHKLLPVPVDLELETLAPRLDQIEAAITPRTRAIVAAHLFGSRVPMEPILQIARRHGLVVIEDVAQSLTGPQDRGHPDSDAALFSFGPIKTATALGGALVRGKDRELLARMRQIAAEYPLQPRMAYLKRVLKYAGFQVGLSRPAYTSIAAVLKATGCDYDRIFANLVRGFPGPDLIPRLRQRPCASLMGLVARRLSHFNSARLERRGERGHQLAKRLAPRFCLPGHAASEHSHWVVPILADDPPAMIAYLARAGFHATQGRSLCVVPPPPDALLQPSTAQRLLGAAVFLPIYPELPERELDRLAKVLLVTSHQPQAAALHVSPPPKRLPPGATSWPARTTSGA